MQGSVVYFSLVQFYVVRGWPGSEEGRCLAQLDLCVQEERTLESEKMQLQMLPRGKIRVRFRAVPVVHKRWDKHETHS